MSDQLPQAPYSHEYRNHLIITKHIPQELDMRQGDRQVVGAHLVRPYPEARILFVDHVDRMLYVYWIDQNLMDPNPR